MEKKFWFWSVIIGVLLLQFFSSCQKHKPTVSTELVTNIQLNQATSGGKVLDDGNASVIDRGVCWNTNLSPTISDNKTSDGSGMGSFTSSITQLTPKTQYYVRAFATNSEGTSYGSEVSFTTNDVATTVPGAPISVSATVGNAQAIVTFTAPISNGGLAITGYTVTSNPGNITVTGSASPITVTGLTNGTSYTFTVIATNSTGNSLPSSASNSVIPSTVPGAPTIVSATAGNAQAVITFTAPESNGGSAITGYTVTSSPGGSIGVGSASPISVTGLIGGTAYTFTVTATNVNGISPESSASNSVTPPLTDGDGNVYNIITLGTQVWMKENLKTTRYRNGDLIETTIPSSLDISTLVNPKYQWSSTDSVYGKLYTWYSVIDSRNVCPLGWHVPSFLEWTTLTNFLGGDSVAGYKMKESGEIHWWMRECLCKQATNESGFTGLPAGCRYANGNLTEIGKFGYWWSTTEANDLVAIRFILYYWSQASAWNNHIKSDGLSVRCLKDN